VSHRRTMSVVSWGHILQDPQFGDSPQTSVLKMGALPHFNSENWTSNLWNLGNSMR